MTKLYESQYLAVFFDENNSLLTIEWDKNSKNMDPEIFKKEALIYLDFIKENKPHKIINNLLNFKYLLSPEEQLWYVNKMVDKGNDVEKIALLVNEEYLIKMTFEQTKGELRRMVENRSVHTNYFIRYFSEIDKAKKWMLKK